MGGINPDQNAEQFLRTQKKAQEFEAAKGNSTPMLQALAAGGDEFYDSVAGTTYRWVNGVAVPWRKPWTAFTPVFSTFTLGNGTVTGYYRIVEGYLEGWIKIVLGSTSSVGASPRFQLILTPFAAQVSEDFVLGEWRYRDVSANDTYYGSLSIYPTTLDAILFRRLAQSTTYTAASIGRLEAWGSSNPVNTGTGDVISGTFGHMLASAA